LIHFYKRDKWRIIDFWGILAQQLCV